MRQVKDVAESITDLDVKIGKVGVVLGRSVADHLYLYVLGLITHSVPVGHISRNATHQRDLGP